MTHPHVHRPIIKCTQAATMIAAENYFRSTGFSERIGFEDAKFLLSMIDRERPTSILEIGVSSGTSSYLMLKMTEALGLPGTLTSVDTAEFYGPEPSRPTGFLVPEVFGHAPDNWLLLTKVGAYNFRKHQKYEAAGHEPFSMVFIDANHAQPWPTLDLLSVIPLVGAKTWVVLHDINLPLIGYPGEGAVHAFRDWPLESCMSDLEVPNIGAIRFSDRPLDDTDHIIESLKHPWEVTIPAKQAQQIFNHFSTFLNPTQLNRVRLYFQ